MTDTAPAARTDVAEVIIAGLHAPVTDDERKAWRSPPYPLPPGLVAIRQRLLTELDAHLRGCDACRAADPRPRA